MRHLFALSLVLMGCGDNLGGDGAGTEDLGDLGGAVEDNGVVGKLVPQVCAARSWSEVQTASKDVDLTVVPTAGGAAVLHVPRTGGMLGGFLLDGRGLIVGDPAGTEIMEGKWTDVSASVSDGRLVVGLTDGTSTTISILRDDLGDYRKLTRTDGALLGDAVVMTARDTRFTATGGTSGMLKTTFDSGWTAMDTEVFSRSVPTGMTSAAYGDDGMIAWSTTTSCHLQRISSGIAATQDFACTDARLATNYADREGELVWQGGRSVMLSNIRADAHNEIANVKVLAAEGTSPRVVFDGERFWVSYLNKSGVLIVGYLDDSDTLVSTSVDLRPLPGAHELVVMDGTLWAFAFDAETGFGASRLCLVRE